MAKTAATSNGVYAVLLERNLKGDHQQASSSTYVTRASLDGDEQTCNSKGRCQLPKSCLGWSLLLALSTTCLIVVTFHLWFTWHLQLKVAALQAQVDTLSPLDFQELRKQIRDLNELRDFINTERESGLPGLPTSADEDEVIHFSLFF